MVAKTRHVRSICLGVRVPLVHFSVNPLRRSLRSAMDSQTTWMYVGKYGAGLYHYGCSFHPLLTPGLNAQEFSMPLLTATLPPDPVPLFVTPHLSMSK